MHRRPVSARQVHAQSHLPSNDPAWARGLGARVAEEAGAEEHYRRDGTLAWRRVFRRSVTDHLREASNPAPGESLFWRFVGAAICVQVGVGVVMGAMLLLDGHDPGGRGAATGYLLGSLVVTLCLLVLARD